MQLNEHFSEAEMELLRLRADRVAAPIKESNEAGCVISLMVTLGTERYALPSTGIAAVYQQIAISPLPCVPPFVAGVANIRGYVIPVLNLASILGIGSSNLGQSALIIVDTDGLKIGLLVESLEDICDLSMTNMNPVNDNMGLRHPEYFLGIFPNGMALLSVPAIVNDPRLIVDDSLT